MNTTEPKSVWLGKSLAPNLRSDPVGRSYTRMPLGAATASFEPLAENARDVGALIGAAFGGVAGAASVLGAESVRSSYNMTPRAPPIASIFPVGL